MKKLLQILISKKKNVAYNMKFIFFYSVWLQLWATLYYLKVIKIPPLYELLVIALIVSTGTYLFFNKLNDILVLLFIVITHLLPLYIVKKNYDNNTIIINFIVIFLYVLFMSYNNLDIIEFYKKSILVSKKGIVELLKFSF